MASTPRAPQSNYSAPTASGSATPYSSAGTPSPVSAPAANPTPTSTGATLSPPLGTGDIHGSGSENNILRVAAGLGDPAIPVQLACALGNLDRTNISLVAAAIFRADGSGTALASNPS